MNIYMESLQVFLKHMFCHLMEIKHRHKTVATGLQIGFVYRVSE